MGNETALEKLRQLTGHKHIKLTNCGDTAILIALTIAKSLIKLENPVILIPDQSGWLSYKTLPKLLGFKVVEVKTADGVIDLKDLEKKLKETNAVLLIFQSLAGYFAKQPSEEIIKICHKSGCKVIDDVTGTIGFENICSDADFMVCSFGENKLVNLGYGGFISAQENVFKTEEAMPILRIARNCINEAELIKRLELLKKRALFLKEKAKKIKKDLANYNVVHSSDNGINVIVAYTAEKEKKEITDYCEKNNLEFTLCPRYIRLNKKAVCIEVKKLKED